VVKEAVEFRVESAEEIAPAPREEIKRWTDEVFGQIAYQWARAQWYATARTHGLLVGSLKVVAREITARRSLGGPIDLRGLPW
jgi:hypothetical protein